MKIARWLLSSGDTGEGFVVDDVVVPFPGGVGVAQVLIGGLAAAQDMHEGVSRSLRSGKGHRMPLAGVRLLAPLLPTSIRDFVAFEEHVEGVSAGIEGTSHVAEEWYEAPTFYFSNSHTVRATGDVIAVPQTQRLDFELELAAVIGGLSGSSGENVDVETAAAHIFGYTIMNDWSARDLQAREMRVRLGPAKGKDFGTTLGPWIVTSDELAPFRDEDGFLELRAEVRVNGHLIGADLVSNMGWPFPELVTYASRNSVVVPGDVLGSGTVGNGGCLAELWGRNGALTPPPLEAGDEVRMTIEGVGEIVNVVGTAVPGPPVPRARPRKRIRRRPGDA